MSDEMPAEIADLLEGELEEAALTIIGDTTFEGITSDGRKWTATILEADVMIPSWTWKEWSVE